jgi:hypothetical protein
MSNTSIQLKKSGATGNTPTGLSFGEVAINYADGKLYYKNALGGTSYISNQFSFDTINANNSLILATGVSDTLSFVAGNNISISTNTTTKTITIDSTASGGGGNDTYARDTANAAFLQANAAYASQNTTGTYANSAYTQANTATNNAAGASLYANGAFIQANAAFNRANSVLGGFRANTLIVANGTGFLSNSNAEFSLANNTLYVVNATATNTFFANSVTFNDGTKLISASGLIASNAATANVAINARITNVTTGTYFPIVTDTTITGADTFHYSSNDFLMYAANNTFRATGNVWAGQFLTVGTNIPVVNSTGHWVGQTVNGIDSFARTTANAALPTTGGTVTGNLTLSTTSTMIIQNTRTCTSNSTGALIVRGGVGIAGNLFVGGIFTVDGDFQVGNTTSTGNVFNSGYVTFSQPTLFTSNAASTSNITGAIIVSGGAGIKGNIHSGSITITGPTSNGITFADATFQNTAFSSSVYNTLNVTTSTANTALAKAQSAYDLANTTTSLSIITDKFVANGNTTTFTLSTTPVTENFVTLVVDGVTQMRDTYSISGNVVTFNSTFENTANIEATTITGQGTISGATGGGTDRVFQVNETIITQPYTLTALRGASSVGPIAINDGVAVTLEDGARWVIL